jgi:NADPH:quinone reductase-like Zn-dependent oxidoreductase
MQEILNIWRPFMKAIVWTKYGPPEALQLDEMGKPSPKNNELLIKVHAATVTAGDCDIRKSRKDLWYWFPLRIYTGIFKPRIKILGQEMAGEVEAIGKDVTQFKVGDQVVASTGMGFGAYAQYKCVAEDTGGLAIKPSNMSYEEAATLIVGGINALHFLRLAGIQKGDKVLIYGASGSIGTYAVQLAQNYGASVDAVTNPYSLDLMKTLGAKKVYDYKKNDFKSCRDTYDIIFDAVGKCGYSLALKKLNRMGRYITANPSLLDMLRTPWTNITSNKKVSFNFAPETRADLNYLRELIEAGKLKAIIDKQFTLEQIADAHSYVDKGDKTGHVVITVTHDSH